MYEVLAKVREEVTPAIAQKEAEKKAEKEKPLQSVATIKASYSGAKDKVEKLSVDDILKKNPIFDKKYKNAQGEKFGEGDKLLKDIKDTFGKINDPKHITTTISEMDKKIGDTGEEQGKLDKNTQTGKDRYEKLSSEIKRLTEQRNTLQKYLNLLISQIKDVAEKINLAKNNIKAIQKDIKKSGDTSEQTAKKLEAAEKYEKDLSDIQRDLAGMTEGILGSLTAESLGPDTIKSLETILPSLLPENTQISVSKEMKDELDKNDKIWKYLTEKEAEKPKEISFEPQERVTEFTAGNETCRRRQMVASGGQKWDIQISKNQDNISQISLEMKTDIINTGCDIKFVED